MKHYRERELDAGEDFDGHLCYLNSDTLPPATEKQDISAL
jgi:hypothetical protein